MDNGGTELTADFGWEIYDTPFRSYDAQLGRFHQVDPLADSQSSFTPYHFAYNDPIYWSDPSGLFPDIFGMIDELLNSDYGGSWSESGGINFYESDLGAFMGGFDYIETYDMWDENDERFADVTGGASGAISRFQEFQDEKDKIDLSKELGLIGLTIDENGKHQWVAKTKKGRYRIHSRSRFKGNQYTTNTNFFKKAGIVGLFVQVGIDGTNLANDSSYKDKFLLNTGLSIASFVVPEIGAGVLIYDGARVVNDVYHALWERPEVDDFFRRLLKDFNRWIYEESGGN